MTSVITHPVVEYLTIAGLFGYLKSYDVVDAKAITGKLRPELLDQLVTRLKADPRFGRGVLHGLHDVGEHPIDFRSHHRELGARSLQLVFDQRTGKFDADLDEHAAYSGVLPYLGHAVEVTRNFFRRLFKRSQ